MDSTERTLRVGFRPSDERWVLVESLGTTLANGTIFILVPATPSMDRSKKSYLLIHYILLITLILFIAEGIDRITGSTPFWLGLLIAVLVGILYPRIVAAAGVAPEGWER